MIMSPKLNRAINNAEELLSQEDITWSIGEGYGVGELMKQAPIGSTPRRLMDQGKRLNIEWAL